MTPTKGTAVLIYYFDSLGHQHIDQTMV